MDILIPHKEKKRALFIVDVQNGFTKNQKPEYIQAIKQVIQTGEYALFIENTFHAPIGSLWEKQCNWTFEYEPTIPEVSELLPKEKTISIIKVTKSVFLGKLDLVDILHKQGIQEIHIVGFDTNDCVFATAQNSFDLGFETYVIEEATGSSSGEAMRNHAIEILRALDMTNNSLS